MNVLNLIQILEKYPISATVHIYDYMNNGQIDFIEYDKEINQVIIRCKDEILQ